MPFNWSTGHPRAGSCSLILLSDTIHGCTVMLSSSFQKRERESEKMQSNSRRHPLKLTTAALVIAFWIIKSPTFSSSASHYRDMRGGHPKWRFMRMCRACFVTFKGFNSSLSLALSERVHVPRVSRWRARDELSVSKLKLCPDHDQS